MPRVMKPPSTYDSSNTDTGGGDWYDGPPPPPALYKGTIKKMLLHKTKDGELRIMVLCEINDGKYKGAGVTKWLQLTEQGSPWVNQFLHSLTDGSDQQKKAIRKAFKEIGYEVGDADQKKRLPILKIGKKTVPVGKTVAFVTKLRTSEQDGVTRAEISRFVVPRDANEEDETEEPDDGLDDEDSGLDDGTDLDSDDTEPDESDDTEAGSDDGGDDPWSV